MSSKTAGTGGTTTPWNAPTGPAAWQCSVCKMWVYGGYHTCMPPITPYAPPATTPTQIVYMPVDLSEIIQQLKDIKEELKELKDIIAKQQ